MQKEHEFIWPEGVKKTRQRVCVLSVLEHASAPLGAADIYRQLEEQGASVSLSTVYRILELLVQKEVAVKTTVLDHDMAIYELNRNQHKHYAVCMHCHKIIEINNCPLESYVPQLADSGFHVLGHKVEMYGYCKNCSGKKPPD